MFRCRTGIAVGLVAAFLALPFAADRCVAVCAAARAAAAANAAPACHHSSSTGAMVSHVPNRCSQDHDGTPGVSAASTPSDRLMLAAVTIAPPLTSSTCLTDSEWRHSGTAPPSRQSSVTARSASLRI